MLEKIKKNKNEWYLHSLGVMLLAVAVILKGHVEISFALYGLSIVLMGIGALYNQNKQIISMNKKLIIKSREEIIYERTYEYTKDGATVMLNKAELLNVFMNEENQSHQKAKDE